MWQGVFRGRFVASRPRRAESRFLSVIERSAKQRFEAGRRCHEGIPLVQAEEAALREIEQGIEAVQQPGSRAFQTAAALERLSHPVVAGEALVRAALVASACLDVEAPTEALAIFWRLSELDPTEGHFLVGLGNAHAQLTAYDAAVAAFSKALVLNPHDCAALIGRGHANLALAHEQAAHADFQKALDLGVDGDVELALRACMELSTPR